MYFMLQSCANTRTIQRLSEISRGTAIAHDGETGPIRVIDIAAEMLLFTDIHLTSGDESLGPIIYWLVVATVCAFIAYGRFVLQPL